MSGKLFRFKMPEAGRIYHSSFINVIQKYNVTFEQTGVYSNDKILVNYIFKSREDEIKFCKESIYANIISDDMYIKTLEEIKEKRDVFIGELV